MCHLPRTHVCSITPETTWSDYALDTADLVLQTDHKALVNCMVAALVNTHHSQTSQTARHTLSPHTGNTSYHQLTDQLRYK